LVSPIIEASVYLPQGFTEIWSTAGNMALILLSDSQSKTLVFRHTYGMAGILLYPPDSPKICGKLLFPSEIQGNLPLNDHSCFSIRLRIPEPNKIHRVPDHLMEITGTAKISVQFFAVGVNA